MNYCEQCKYCYAEQTKDGEVYYCGNDAGRGFKSVYENPCSDFEEMEEE